jgi:hypothetical protein
LPTDDDDDDDFAAELDRTIPPLPPLTATLPSSPVRVSLSRDLDPFVSESVIRYTRNFGGPITYTYAAIKLFVGGRPLWYVTGDSDSPKVWAALFDDLCKAVTIEAMLPDTRITVEIPKPYEITAPF